MSVFGWIARRLQPGQEERERVGERERYRAWLENRKPGQSFPLDRMQAEADARRERRPDMLRYRAQEAYNATRADYFKGSPVELEGRPMTDREGLEWQKGKLYQALQAAMEHEIEGFVDRGVDADVARRLVRGGGGNDKGAVFQLSHDYHVLERRLAALDAAEATGAEPAPESEPTQAAEDETYMALDMFGVYAAEAAEPEAPEAIPDFGQNRVREAHGNDGPSLEPVVGKAPDEETHESGGGDPTSWRRARGIWHYETPAEVARDQRWAEEAWQAERAEVAERAGVTAEGARAWEPVAVEPTAAAEPMAIERGPLAAAEEALALEFMLDEPTRDEEAEAPTPEAVPDFEHEAQEASGTRWPYGLVPAPPKAALLAPVDDKAELRRRAREEQAERERAAAEAYQKNLDGLIEMGLSARAGETPGAEHEPTDGVPLVPPSSRQRDVPQVVFDLRAPEDRLEEEFLAAGMDPETMVWDPDEVAARAAEISTLGAELDAVNAAPAGLLGPMEPVAPLAPEDEVVPAPEPEQEPEAPDWEADQQHTMAQLSGLQEVADREGWEAEPEAPKVAEEAAPLGPEVPLVMGETLRGWEAREDALAEAQEAAAEVATPAPEPEAPVAMGLETYNGSPMTSDPSEAAKVAQRTFENDQMKAEQARRARKQETDPPSREPDPPHQEPQI